jgi:ferric-dicitrate binding protein FerR (iron transport regulator)
LINFNRYNNLAAKYLSGNCNSTEKEQFELWLLASDEHKQWFETQKAVWNFSNAAVLSTEVDVEAALSKVHQRIAFMQEHHQHEVKHARKFVSVYRWVASAAAVFLLGLAVLFFMKNEQTSTLQHITATQKSETPLQLPDGSEVYLNENSEIGFPEQFADGLRQTTFKGIGLFEIAANPDKPFQIVADHFGVEVLGTKFNINAVPGADHYKVDLLEGKIRLFTFDQNPEERIEQLILLPGERGVFDSQSRRLSRVDGTDHNFLFWKTGILEFINTPLTDALKTINENYAINFILAEQHNDLRITARFENESSDELIESLQTIFNFEVTRNGQTVYLR